MRLLISIYILLFFLQIAALPAFGLEQKNQSILKSIRTEEHEKFTRIMFEFQNAVKFSNPEIEDNGKFSVLFFDSSTDIKPLTVYETDSAEKVRSVEFIRNNSNLTANVTLTFPHFMIKTFTLSSPDRVVVDAYRLTASTKDSASLKSVRTEEHENFTRIMFEFQNTVKFKDPQIEGDGKFSVLFFDSSTELHPLSTDEPDSAEKVKSLEFIQDNSNLTANVNLAFPYFMIKAFTLSSPDRVVVDAYRLTASTNGFVPNTSSKGDTVSFLITSIDVSGNTLLSSMEINNILKPYTGRNKTAEDVEKARLVLEKYYHQKGYPTALVNIPRQSVEDGSVTLEVIESKICQVRITGNRYFTLENLFKKIPVFRPGKILYLPKVKKQLAQLNRNPDLKVAPILIPGKKLGTIDVELRVKDKLPLHGSLELNNRSTHTTSSIRVNGMLRYDNLWQKEHSILFQFQTAPKETDEVKLFTGSYSLPAPWNDNQMLMFYALYSDSDTAVAGDINVLGKGKIFGGQWIIPLPAVESYFHNMIVGLDYKDFKDNVAEDFETPVKYFPLHASYYGVAPDISGQTRFNFGATMNLRQTGSDMTEFQEKRYGSKNNFFYATMGLERFQKLPWGMHVWLQADGQLAGRPLISNEQYIAGGVNSVRGYKENEAAGDDAFHFSSELRGPDIGYLANIGKWFAITPYLFYDYAALHIQDPLPLETENIILKGAGAGARGYFFKRLEYQFDMGVALEDTEDTEAGDCLSHFFLRFKF